MWCLGSRGHGWIPVEEAAATVTGEEFALSELVPHLRSHTHAAAGALLVIDTCNAGAARAGETVVTDERLGLDERAHGLAFRVERGQFNGILPLANGGAGAGLFEGGGKRLDLGACGGEGGFLGFSSLQAQELVIFKTLGFRGREGDFVLDGRSLFRGLDGVKLDAEACRFLSMRGDFAIEAGAKGLFAAEQIGGDSGLTFGGCQRGLGLGGFSRQTSQSERDTITLQIDCLQLYEIFNLWLHPC